MLDFASFTLTDTERACGVTVAAVATAAGRCLYVDGGTAVMVPIGASPALGGAVARAALGAPARFDMLNRAGYPVYRRA